MSISLLWNKDWGIKAWSLGLLLSLWKSPSGLPEALKAPIEQNVKNPDVEKGFLNSKKTWIFIVTGISASHVAIGKSLIAAVLSFAFVNVGNITLLSLY